MTRSKQETGPEKLAAAARAAGVADPLVLDAIRHTPRAAFVPAAYADRAYDDGPVPIPRHQVTTQPSLCATMIAALRLDGTQQVLEVGTGYGYQAALLAAGNSGHSVTLPAAGNRTGPGDGRSSPPPGPAPAAGHRRPSHTGQPVLRLPGPRAGPGALRS